ncbi:MAG: hypothetical protein O2877_01190 [bacterium]|nr:hypothetical protein [bacterium]
MSGIRIRQTKTLWDAGFGAALGLGPQDFQKYLTGTGVGTDSLEPIPEIPVWPVRYPPYLDRDVLVDKRVLAKVGQVEVCRLLGLAYGGSNDTFRPLDPTREKYGLYWMRAHDGRVNRGRMPSDCRRTAESFLVGVDASEGCSIFAQDREVIHGHCMDFFGSVYTGAPASWACLGIIDGRPELYWGWEGGCAFPDYGSVFRGE